MDNESERKSKAMTWKSYLCTCGYMVCRQVAQPCGKCGRTIGPVTNKSVRRTILRNNGWRSIGRTLWKSPNGQLCTFGAAWILFCQVTEIDEKLI